MTVLGYAPLVIGILILQSMVYADTNGWDFERDRARSGWITWNLQFNDL